MQSESHPDTHVNTQIHTREHTDTHTRIHTYIQRCIQTHAQRHTHTHTHTHTYAHTHARIHAHAHTRAHAHTHTRTLFPPASFSHQAFLPQLTHSQPPGPWGRAGPSRKTGWQDSLPRLLSALRGPPSQIPVSRRESRHEGPFIFGKRRCGHISGSWGRKPWPQPGGLVRIAWNEGRRSDLGTQQVLRKG